MLFQESLSKPKTAKTHRYRLGNVHECLDETIKSGKCILIEVSQMIHNLEKYVFAEKKLLLFCMKMINMTDFYQNAQVCNWYKIILFLYFHIVTRLIRFFLGH